MSSRSEPIPRHIQRDCRIRSRRLGLRKGYVNALGRGSGGNDMKSKVAVFYVNCCQMVLCADFFGSLLQFDTLVMGSLKNIAFMRNQHRYFLFPFSGELV